MNILNAKQIQFLGKKACMNLKDTCDIYIGTYYLHTQLHITCMYVSVFLKFSILLYHIYILPLALHCPYRLSCYRTTLSAVPLLPELREPVALPDFRALASSVSSVRPAPSAVPPSGQERQPSEQLARRIRHELDQSIRRHLADDQGIDCIYYNINIDI